jgi:pheromone shutdown protein TraB
MPRDVLSTALKGVGHRMTLKLTEEMTNAINSALADGAPILLAAVQEDGYP